MEGNQMLIGTRQKYLPALTEYIQWKQEGRGFNVQVLTEQDWQVAPDDGDFNSLVQNAQSIFSKIQAKYNSPEGLTYIILVGDLEDVPALWEEGQPTDQWGSFFSDPKYTLLEGDDYIGDAFYAGSWNNAARRMNAW